MILVNGLTSPVGVEVCTYGLPQHVLLLLFNQEGLVSLKQHVLVAVVLCFHLHDVPVLAEDVLSRNLKARALLGVDSLLSSQDLPPGTLGKVQGSRKQAVRSPLEVLVGVTHHAAKGGTRNGLDTSCVGGLHL